MKPFTGLWERTESSLNTVLGLCFLTPRTVVGFCLSTLSKSSMIFSCCLLSYSCRVKSPLRWGVPSTGGVPEAGGVPGVWGLSSLLFPQPSMVIHWGLLKMRVCKTFSLTLTMQNKWLKHEADILEINWIKRQILITLIKLYAKRKKKMTTVK